MSKAEKRQFKRFAGRVASDGDNNYVRLFDAMDGQQVYNEPQLKAAFAGEKFTRNFSVAKAYLYETILQSLRSSRRPSTVEMDLRRSLDAIELLYQRGLGAQARKILRRALNKSRREQLPGYTAELLHWDRRLTDAPLLRKHPGHLLELETAEASAIQQLAAESRLHSLRARIRAIFLARLDLRKPEVAEEVQSLISDPLLQNSPHGLPFFAHLAYHYAHAIYNRLTGAPEATQAHYRSALLLWEDQPHIQRSHPDQYLNALTTYLDACLRVHRFDDFAATIAQIKGLATNSERLQARAFYLGQHLELRYAITSGQLDLGRRQHPAIEAGLRKHRAHLHRNIELTLLYNLTVTHFLARDFSASIRLINRLLNEPERNIRQDIYDALRLFELVAHYEMDHLGLLESLLRSFDRRLRTRPREHPYEKLLLRAIRRLMDVPEPEKKEILEQLGGAMESMPGAIHTTGREELQLWVRSWVEEKPVEELLREGLG